METRYLSEAFKELRVLNEEEFPLTAADGIQDIKDFVDADEKEDFVEIIDPEAETEEELEDSYIGKVILDCCVCHSKIYKNREDIVISEEDNLANEGEECPFCFSNDGYKIIGQVQPFEEVEKEMEEENEVDEPEETEEDFDESLDDFGILSLFDNKDELPEGIDPKMNKKKDEPNNLAARRTKNRKDNAKLTNKSLLGRKHGRMKSIEEDYEDWDDDEYEREYSWYEDDICHPLYNLFERACDELNVWAEPSIEGHYGSDCFLSKDNDKPLYEVIFSSECDYMDDLWFEIEDNWEAIKEDEVAKKKLVDRIKDYIISNPYEDEDEELDEAKSKKSKKSKEDITDKVIDKLCRHYGDNNVVPDMENTGIKVTFNKEGVDNKFAMELINKYDLDYKDADNGIIVLFEEKSKELEEGFEKVEIETEDQTLSMDSDPSGEVVVRTAPKAQGMEMRADKEVIGPIDDITKDEIEADSEEDEVEETEIPNEDEVELDVDEFDEDSFNELGESYLKDVYDNVVSFKTNSVKSLADNKLVVEGVIRFTSGKKKQTSFIFEAKEVKKNNKLTFSGLNEQICRGKKSFTLNGKLDGNRFISESLNYNYRAKDENGNSKKVYGTVNVKTVKGLAEACKDKECRSPKKVTKEKVACKGKACKKEFESKLNEATIGWADDATLEGDNYSPEAKQGYQYKNTHIEHDSTENKQDPGNIGGKILNYLKTNNLNVWNVMQEDSEAQKIRVIVPQDEYNKKSKLYNQFLGKLKYELKNKKEVDNSEYSNVEDQYELTFEKTNKVVGGSSEEDKQQSKKLYDKIVNELIPAAYRSGNMDDSFKKLRAFVKKQYQEGVLTKDDYDDLTYEYHDLNSKYFAEAYKSKKEINKSLDEKILFW